MLLFRHGEALTATATNTILLISTYQKSVVQDSTDTMIPRKLEANAATKLEGKKRLAARNSARIRGNAVTSHELSPTGSDGSHLKERTRTGEVGGNISAQPGVRVTAVYSKARRFGPRIREATREAKTKDSVWPEGITYSGETKEQNSDLEKKFFGIYLFRFLLCSSYASTPTYIKYNNSCT